MRLYSLELAQEANYLVLPESCGDVPVVGPSGAVRVEFDSSAQGADFSHVSAGIGTGTAVSDRAKQVLQSFVGGDVRFIPLESDRGRFWGLEVTREGPVDYDRTTTYRDEDGNLQTERVFYREDELVDFVVFCLPGDGRIFVTDRFLEVVVEHGLTGLNPHVVWDSEERIWRPAPIWPEGPPAPQRPALAEEDEAVLGERALSDDDLDVSAQLLPFGYRLLGVGPEPAAQTIGQAVEHELNVLHASGVSDDETRRTLLALGFLIGDVICRVGGWEWVRLIRASGESVAVVSPDRARFVEPIVWVELCVEDGVDGGVVGLIAGIEQGLRLPGAPGEYWPLP